MTLEELEATLPWGLHDAYLERLQIDWPEAKLVLDVRVMVTEHQDMDQRARITITGLVFCSVDPPEIDSAHGYEALRPPVEPVHPSWPAAPMGYCWSSLRSLGHHRKRSARGTLRP
jgi:hypothetical protein